MIFCALGRITSFKLRPQKKLVYVANLQVKIICRAINFRFNCQVNEVMISHVRGRSQQIIGTSQLATNSIEDNKKPHEKQTFSHISQQQGSTRATTLHLWPL